MPGLLIVVIGARASTCCAACVGQPPSVPSTGLLYCLPHLLQVQRLLEEYYKLDYEDVVGGVRTRFR